HLKKMASPLERARFVHHIVDDYNREIFAHPIVQKFLPCKVGCSGCCHTQVGVTEDEAELLANRVTEGVKIDFARLEKQVQVGNNPENFYLLSYADRRCVFLGTDDSCQVYNDRPSVCRTNAVLGEASQCSPVEGEGEGQTIRLLKTEQADMAIMGSFFMSKESGTLPHMVGKILQQNEEFKKPRTLATKKKAVFKDLDL
ncbi:MAG: YkgJ family cysteine cluster protein, partial [Bacteriovorax sp.]|nr:YkgJ family cysteine cluster protein [Bacteriovorax sp.]